MKVLITGATGWVGSNVLDQALRRPEITEIVLLQRRTCPGLPASTASNSTKSPNVPTSLHRDVSNNPKITTILHSDFTSYPPNLLHTLLPHLHNTSAILWALGGRHDKFPDLETARAVNITYLEVFCAQVLPHLIPSAIPESSSSPLSPSPIAPSTLSSSTSSGRPHLRFVLCSGAMPEPDQDARLWFLAETRKLKGAAEGVVFGAEKTHEGKDGEEGFKAYTMRPAVILAEKPGWGEWLHGKIAPSVSVKELAAVMVDAGVGGGGAERIWEVGAIKKRGRELLKGNADGERERWFEDGI